MAMQMYQNLYLQDRKKFALTVIFWSKNMPSGSPALLGLIAVSVASAKIVIARTLT
jgi:hypothetical protein